MNNYTKALDIAMLLIDCELPTLEKCRKSAMQMAKWKDNQFAEEKKQWIEKACNYIYNHAHVTTFHSIHLDKCSITQFVDIFKQAME